MTTHQKPIGVGIKKPGAMTRAEYQRWYRARMGDRHFFIQTDIESAAACLYLMKQWGFKSRQEAARVSMRYLAILTRLGLQRIDLDVFEPGPEDDPGEPPADD